MRFRNFLLVIVGEYAPCGTRNRVPFLHSVIRACGSQRARRAEPTSLARCQRSLEPCSLICAQVRSRPLSCLGLRRRGVGISRYGIPQSSLAVLNRSLMSERSNRMALSAHPSVSRCFLDSTKCIGVSCDSLSFTSSRDFQDLMRPSLAPCLASSMSPVLDASLASGPTSAPRRRSGWCQRRQGAEPR